MGCAARGIGQGATLGRLGPRLKNLTTRPLSTHISDRSLPNEPEEEPELPLLQVILIGLLLWLVLVLLSLWAISAYW